MRPPRISLRLRAVGGLVAALSCCAAVACGSEERPKAEPQPLSVPGSPAKVSDAQPTADELPVPEDFEAEAEREITRDNARTELDAIERELESGK